MRISDWSSDVCSSDLRIASKKNHQLREVDRLLNALGRHLFVADVKVITALNLFIFAERPQQRFGMAQRLAIETEMIDRSFLPNPWGPILQSRREADRKSTRLNSSH